ncbi:pyridoxamine 5'-phosphate oxidase family protein, partial [Streptomyces caeruleatus]
MVAQSYVFLGDRFFFHCTRFGKLAALIAANPNLTIEIDRPIGLLKAPKGQNTSLEYYSVIARCTATVKGGTDDVRSMQYVALNKYRPEKDYTPLEDGAVNQIVAFDCKIVEMSAKKRILADGQYSPPGQPKAPYVRY